jgi:hypothetical protein
LGQRLLVAACAITLTASLVNSVCGSDFYVTLVDRTPHFGFYGIDDPFWVLSRRDLASDDRNRPWSCTIHSFHGFTSGVCGDGATTLRHIEVPLWFANAMLVLPFIALGANHLRNQRRARRLELNTHPCRHCGYDLRATPQRCPECGMVTPP